MATHPAMTLPATRERPAHGDLHPAVYKTLIGFTVWLLLSVWLLFSRGNYVGLNLIVITAFFLVLVGIPVALWLIWRRDTSAEEQGEPAPRFSDWGTHQFSTWTGGISGREATMQILLPIAAVSIGMTIFGLVFAFAVPRLG